MNTLLKASCLALFIDRTRSLRPRIASHAASAAEIEPDANETLHSFVANSKARASLPTRRSAFWCFPP